MKLNMKDNQSVDASNSLRWGNRIIMRVRGKKGTGGRGEAEEKNGWQDLVWEETGEKSRGSGE